MKLVLGISVTSPVSGWSDSRMCCTPVTSPGWLYQTPGFPGNWHPVFCRHQKTLYGKWDCRVGLIIQRHIVWLQRHFKIHVATPTLSVATRALSLWRDCIYNPLYNTLYHMIRPQKTRGLGMWPQKTQNSSSLGSNAHFRISSRAVGYYKDECSLLQIDPEL